MSIQTTTTGQGSAYVLKGYGAIDPGWLRDCLKLFKDHQVNIRRLVLMQEALPDCLPMLEIQFALPVVEAAQRPPFETHTQAVKPALTPAMAPVTTPDPPQDQTRASSIKSAVQNSFYDGFLGELEAHVSQQEWKERTLTPNSSNS